MEALPFACTTAALLGLALGWVAWRPSVAVARPRLILLLLALPTLAAGATLLRFEPLGLRLSIDPSTEPLLPAGDPAQQSYRAAVRDFGDDEVFVIAMECDDAFRREHLEALQRLGDRIARLPGVVGVKSLTDVYSFRYVPEQDWIEIRPFVEALPEGDAALARLRAEALAEPLYRDTLVSRDGRTTAINVFFREMTDREFIASDVDGAIERLLAAETTPTRRFFVAGRPHVKTRVYHVMLNDLARLIPAALAALAGVLALVTGTRRGVALPLGVVALATLWTFGAMAYLERPLTVLTTLLAPVLAAVGSVYGVHVLARFEEALEETSDAAQAARLSVEHLTLPVLIAGLTTLVGFGALMLSDVPAVFELGALSVLGVASITLLSLSFVPAALVLLPERRAAHEDPAPTRWIREHLDRGLRGLTQGVVRRPRLALAAWGLLSLAALVAIPRIEIDSDFLSFFAPGSPVRRDFEAVNRLLSGAVPLYVTLTGEGPGSFREPHVLGALEDLQARLAPLPGVSHTASFLDTLRRLNRAFERDDPRAERIPETRAGVMELLFLIPKGELGRFVNLDQSRANLVVRTGQVGSSAIRDLVGRIEATLAARPLPGVTGTAVTGNTILLARSADGIASGQPRAVGLAALVIFGLVAASFRSLRLGLTAMVPNVVPVLLFFGLLGAGAAPLSLPTSLIGSITLGIAIDGTVHYLVRYRRERDAGRTPEAAALVAGQRVGRPVVIATGMLCLGFAVVALSGFATLRQFGVLASATMAICLASDLVLLPALLVRR